MTTASLPISAASRRAAPDQKGWFSRLVDRIVEARMRQADVEIRRQLERLAPELIEQKAHKEAVGTNWTLPFVRGT